MAEYTNRSQQIDLTGNELLLDQINVKATAGLFIAGSAVTATAAEQNVLAGVVAGTTSANKALVVDASKRLDTLDILNVKNKGFTIASLLWVDVVASATLLDGALTVTIVAGNAGDQFKIRQIRLVGGGTNFGAGGDRDLSITDGTTIWTTIAAADLKTAPSATLDWGNAKVPYLTGTSNIASVAASTIGLKYTGGTTDYSGTGSITFSVGFQKTA